MQVLAIGPEVAGPHEITNFSGVWTFYVARELRRLGIALSFAPRPDKLTAAEFYANLNPLPEHVIAFGSRHFERIPGHVGAELSRRIKGAVCQFNDAPLKRPPHADLTFVCKGLPDGRHVVVGWAADPDLLAPLQPPDVLHILVDHPDYVANRGDISAAVLSDVHKFAWSSQWCPRWKNVKIEVLESPKAWGFEATSFYDLCRRYYSRAHLFLLTHPESVGLSVIETATAGALPVVPKGFMADELLRTVRHVEYDPLWTIRIPWSRVLAQINPQESRDMAMRQTWRTVAKRIVVALATFRKDQPRHATLDYPC